MNIHSKLGLKASLFQLSVFILLSLGVEGIALGQPPYPSKGLNPAYEWEKVDPKHRYGWGLFLRNKIFEDLQVKNGTLWAWNGKFLSWLNEVDQTEIPSVDYLNRERRKSYVARIKGNALVNARISAALSQEDIDVMFVMGQNGKFYIAQKTIGDPNRHTLSFHHSSFFSGNPVASAGMLTLEKRTGVIKQIYNESGHYRFGEEGLQLALTELSEQGVDLKQILVSAYGKDSSQDRDAATWLEQYNKNSAK